MTMKSVKRIVDIAEMASILWVDDVWITGILRTKAGISHINAWTKWYSPYVEHLKVKVLNFDFNMANKEFITYIAKYYVLFLVLLRKC